MHITGFPTVFVPYASTPDSSRGGRLTFSSSSTSARYACRVGKLSTVSAVAAMYVPPCMVWFCSSAYR